jgi:hypothetical protein
VPGVAAAVSTFSNLVEIVHRIGLGKVAGLFQALDEIVPLGVDRHCTIGPVFTATQISNRAKPVATPRHTGSGDGL